MGVVHFGALLGRDAALGKKVPTTERLDNTKNADTTDTTDTNVSLKSILLRCWKQDFIQGKLLTACHTKLLAHTGAQR